MPLYTSGIFCFNNFLLDIKKQIIYHYCRLSEKSGIVCEKYRYTIHEN
jgi:hypothetical protein